jgi:hypothetical protein
MHSNQTWRDTKKECIFFFVGMVSTHFAPIIEKKLENSIKKKGNTHDQTRMPSS